MDFTIKLVGIYFSILGMTDYNWSMFFFLMMIYD